jgi:dienelactone hydrolase
LKTSRRGFLLGLAVFGVLAPAVAAGSVPSTHAAASLAIVPAVSVADEPLHISSSGLPANVLASIELSSTDSQGTKWYSSATFRTSARGRVDVDRTPALGGSYKGVWGMGLMVSMLPRTRPYAGSYVWAGARRQTFTARVRVNRELVATRVFGRTLSLTPIRHEVEQLGNTGFYGEYYAPVGLAKRPAVLAFGGAAGGLRTSLLASMLAARGYPTLALAYFREPGLPKRISGIPLEYFANALTWLGRRREVDVTRMFALGISRGSEAALLLGVHFPKRVYGVIGAVPNNRALCPTGKCSSAPWTIGGQPIPFTNQFDDPHPTDNPNAVIPVERIRGPIFLACAEADKTWNSCGFARAIMQRLDADGDRYRHVLFADPSAGHMLGTLAPDQPLACACLLRPVDARARAVAWAKLIAFLKDVTAGG